MEKASLKFKGCYQILNTDGKVIAELLTPTDTTINDTTLLKRIIDVVEQRYFKLRDMQDGLDVQITLEDGGRVVTKE